MQSISQWTVSYLQAAGSTSGQAILGKFLTPVQWCIAKHGGGYTQKGVAYMYTVYPAYLWSLRWVYAVKKNPEVGVRCIPAYTPITPPPLCLCHQAVFFQKWTRYYTMHQLWSHSVCWCLAAEGYCNGDQCCPVGPGRTLSSAANRSVACDIATYLTTYFVMVKNNIKQTNLPLIIGPPRLILSIVPRPRPTGTPPLIPPRAKPCLGLAWPSTSPSTPGTLSTPEPNQTTVLYGSV